MTVTITQLCNMCGTERILDLGHLEGLRTIQNAANINGWREVQHTKHLCPKCIKSCLIVQ